MCIGLDWIEVAKTKDMLQELMEKVASLLVP